MSNIPPQFLELAESAELYDEVEKIGKKYNLHIDQIGELDAEIRDVLNGVAKSSDFVKDVTQRLEIASDLAKQIADEINAGIFDVLKKRVQEEQDSAMKTQTTNSIEQAGGFSVVQETEKPPLGKPVTAEDRPKILDNLENPVPGKERMVPKEENFSEPLVDHLISKPDAQSASLKATPTNLPTGNGPQTEKKTVPPKAAPIKTRPAGPDPYREPVQ